MNTHRIDLDVSKETSPKVVYIAQGDKAGTTIQASIYDNSAALSLAGRTARFRMRLPYNGGYVEGACSVSGNVVTYVVDEEHCASVPGMTDVAYFDILEGADVIASTGRFSVIVLPDASAGVDPARAWTNGVTEFLEDADGRVDAMAERVEDVSGRAEAAIAAMGDISELAVPLMTPDVRGGARLGRYMAVDSAERVDVSMDDAAVDAAVSAAFS